MAAADARRPDVSSATTRIEPIVLPSARLNRPLPAKLERVVLACLEKEPDQRPESANALRDLLDACDDVPLWSDEDARA